MDRRIHRLLRFFDIVVAMTIYEDAATACGISHRFGEGRIKHLEVKTLWLQQFTGGRRGDENVADVP
eukprot:2909972-Heterocapsa_arctica.AAC.1